MNTAPEQTNCPCGSGLLYEECCEIYHLDDQQPASCSPESLMRSRFSAFFKGNVDYLLATLHPAFHSGEERKKIQHALDTHTWYSLRVLRASPTKDKQAQVEFIAFSTSNSAEPQQLHENSNFVFDDNRWWYTDGEMLPALKLQRNEPCWCGSGKKLKKCHS
ncbi:SEC-C motif-containing protein [Alteromonadaceae bacterium Bs31]|nr:SEC-C motif-containing protein [Alteromonadaceae bacterium Bs31]